MTRRAASTRVAMRKDVSESAPAAGEVAVWMNCKSFKDEKDRKGVPTNNA